MMGQKRNIKAKYTEPHIEELQQPHTMRLRPHAYQPAMTELLETFRIIATPEELSDAAPRPVRVIEDPEAWSPVLSSCNGAGQACSAY